MAGELSVRGTIYMHRLGCDLDNRMKPLLDALNGVAWADDGQVAEIHVRRALDRGNPRVEITIEPIEPLPVERRTQAGGLRDAR